MNIIINGGTRGIGREVAIKLAANPSNKILVTGRDESRLKSLSEKYENIIYYKLDIAELETFAEDFKLIISSEFDNVDTLINVAGFLVAKEFLSTSISEAKMMINTNFLGIAHSINLIAPFMKTGAHIVNISSMGGFQGSSKYSGLSYYSASKAAIACLTECLAVEFAGYGIKINCLALGSVQTEMLNEAFPGYNAPIDAKEMAEFISYFALNGQKFFNGKILPVAISNP